MDDSQLTFIFLCDWVQTKPCGDSEARRERMQTLMVSLFYIHHIALLLHEDSCSRKRV